MGGDGGALGGVPGGHGISGGVGSCGGGPGGGGGNGDGGGEVGNGGGGRQPGHFLEQSGALGPPKPCSAATPGVPPL